MIPQASLNSKGTPVFKVDSKPDNLNLTVKRETLPPKIIRPSTAPSVTFASPNLEIQNKSIVKTNQIDRLIKSKLSPWYSPVPSHQNHEVFMQCYQIIIFIYNLVLSFY